jgi:hypothetical protein
MFLIAMLAFELGLAPWLDLSAVGLIVALGAIVYIVLVVPGVGRRGWISVFLLGVAVGFLVDVAGDLPIQRWVDAAIVFTGLSAALILSDSQLWTGREAECEGRRRDLVLLTLAAVVLFALEGTVFDWPVDQTPAALLVVAVILLIAWSLSPGAQPLAGSTEPRVPAVAPLVPAMPGLVVVLGAETAVLPHVGGDPWLQTAPPLAITGALASFSILAYVRTNRSGSAAGVAPFGITMGDITKGARVREAFGPQLGASYRSLVAWIVLFLFSYPILVGRFFELDTFGHRFDGWRAALVVLVINALFLCSVWLAVAFGIDRFADLVRTQWRTIAGAIAIGLARGLPLLLVVTVFFALTAETWEIAAESTVPAFYGLLGVLLAMTLAFVVVSSAIEVRRGSSFKHWGTVRQAALLANEPLGPPDAPFKDALDALGDPTLKDPEKSNLELRGMGWVNATSVLTAYQALVFVPVVIASAVLFWALGKLAVPADVAAEWIYGDGAPEWRGEALEARPFMEEPWTRVALLLGIFSALAFATTVQSSREQRQQFFEATERGIEQLLAVKLVYDRVLESRAHGAEGGITPPAREALTR